MPSPQGNDPGQDFPWRRGPRVPSPGGDGPTVPPTMATPVPFPDSNTPGGAPASTQIPNPADTTPYSPVSAEQQQALSTQDPQFLLNFNYTPQNNQAPGPANADFAQLNASMGTPYEGQDTGFAPRVYNQNYGQPRPQDGQGFPMNPTPNTNPGQVNPVTPRAPTQVNPVTPTAPGTPFSPGTFGNFPLRAGPMQFPNLTRRMGYGAGGGYGSPQ